MAKEFTFQGKSQSELEGLSKESFMKLVTSRKRRSLKRQANPQFDANVKRFKDDLAKAAPGKRPKSVRTHGRETVITPQMIGVTFGVYNGKQFVEVNVLPEMVGHLLGEFALTRKRLQHGKAGIGATKSSTAITAR